MAESSLAVSITDGAYNQTDSILGAVSSLLLLSDISGIVINPEIYVKDDCNEKNIDLLMMIKGWKRYYIDQAIKGDIEYPKFLPEIGTQIKGRMVSLVRRKPIENACARLVAPKYSFIKETITDLNGEFTFNDIEIPDSTNIWIYGINDNGKDNLKVELYPDKKYPLVSKNIVETMNLYSDDWESRKTETINFNNLIENSQMRNYNLQQIEVRANRIEKPKVPVISKFSYVVPNSLLENKRTQCLNDVLRSSLSGYFESTDVDTGRSNKDGSILETGFRFKYKGHYCKIFIDGMEQPQYKEKFWFEKLRNDAIEQIELIDSFSSV